MTATPDGESTEIVVLATSSRAEMLLTWARWSVARAIAGVSATDACAGRVVVPNPTCADAAYVGAWADASTAAAAPAMIATTRAIHNLDRAAAIFAMRVVR